MRFGSMLWGSLKSTLRKAIHGNQGSGQEKYGQAAQRVTAGLGVLHAVAQPRCCDGSIDPITSNLYGSEQTGELYPKKRFWRHWAAAIPRL